LGVVVEHREGNAAEEGGGSVVPVAECLGGLRRIGFEKHCIAVRQHEHLLAASALPADVGLDDGVAARETVLGL
jgi:hypothetical protein